MLLLIGLAATTLSARAEKQHVWLVTSPDHEQTFAYGTEQSRIWRMWGNDKHLALLLSFTNDPFVDRNDPRQYDNFIFHFRNIRLGADGQTFFYHTPTGRSIPVATKKSGFLGIPEIKLVPSSTLIIKQPHGYLTVSLVIEDRYLYKILK